MLTMKRSLWIVVVAIAASGWSRAEQSPPATAQEGTSGTEKTHHEVPRDVPAALKGPRQTSPALPPEFLGRASVFTVQVNVDPNGHNIVGDAANEPSIAIDPTNPNHMAIGWRQFDTIASNFRQAGRAYTSDNGRHWTFPGVLTPGVFRSDPVLASDSDGTFYYYSLSTQGGYLCQLFISDDHGVTWSAPIPAFGGDKNWLTVDRVAGLGNGHLYGVWQRFYGCCDDDTLTRSINSGASFQSPVFMPSSPTFGTLAVGPEHQLYAAGIEAIDYQNYDQFVVARSTNAHDPFQTPTFVTALVDLNGSMAFGGGPNPGGLLGQAQVVVDHSTGPTHGYVYLLCSVDPPGDDPMDVYIARSTDGGATWDAPARVNDDPVGTNAWQWFGTIAVAPNGRIDVVWNDTRTSGQTNLSELYYSFSTDAGQTWSLNQPISPPFDSFLGWPNQNKLGDYYDMISDNAGASLAWAATFNGEQDVYYTRIGEFDCNGNGVGDPADLVAGTMTELNGNGIPDQCELLGDVNCDGVVNFADINPFVMALVDPDQYALQYPDCVLWYRDTNGDDAFTFADINPFVTLLTLP